MSLLADLQKALGDRVEPRVDLAARTSMRVGGLAELFAIVPDEEHLARAIDLCLQRAAPYHVLGAGSNTLVSDRGVRGLVLRLGSKIAPEESSVHGDLVTLKVSAGQPLSRVMSLARLKDCVGMEFLAGIPGTVGGAVVMNAGTKAGSTERICTEIGVCEPGRFRTLSAAEIGFAYRRTHLPEHTVVTWARFRLRIGDVEEVQRSRTAVEDDLANRRRTQPLTLPNSGSIFRNPPGDHAARLIQACGLKGERQGDAQISEVHANFIVNRGSASASDVLTLMRKMQDAVLEKFAVLLVPEVKLMGEFDTKDLPRGIGMPAEPAA